VVHLCMCAGAVYFGTFRSLEIVLVGQLVCVGVVVWIRLGAVGCVCVFIYVCGRGVFRYISLVGNSLGGVVSGCVGLGVWIRLDAGGCVCAFMYLCGSDVFQYISLVGKSLVGVISGCGCSGVHSFECGWMCVCVYVCV